MTFPIELRTERLILREPEPVDAPAIWGIVRDHELVFGPHGFARSEDDIRSWIDAYGVHARSDARTQHRFCLRTREPDEIIGSGRVYIENVWDAWGSLGYALRRESRGMGFATEAASAMLSFAFDVLNLHRVESTIEPDNHASISVATKVGMRREGLLRGRLHYAGDEWRDAALFAITAADRLRAEAPR